MEFCEAGRRELARATRTNEPIIRPFTKTTTDRHHDVLNNLEAIHGSVLDVAKWSREKMKNLDI